MIDGTHAAFSDEALNLISGEVRSQFLKAGCLETFGSILTGGHATTMGNFIFVIVRL